MVQCWASVVDAGPTMNQHWINFLVGIIIRLDFIHFRTPEDGCPTSSTRVLRWSGVNTTGESRTISPQHAVSSFDLVINLSVRPLLSDWVIKKCPPKRLRFWQATRRSIKSRHVALLCPRTRYYQSVFSDLFVTQTWRHRLALSASPLYLMNWKLCNNVM